ncbi:hypothetical protein T439DRAFT_375718 [Meredithblackwellia eburnea MCA 4105]
MSSLSIKAQQSPHEAAKSFSNLAVLKEEIARIEPGMNAAQEDYRTAAEALRDCEIGVREAQENVPKNLAYHGTIAKREESVKNRRNDSDAAKERLNQFDRYWHALGDRAKELPSNSLSKSPANDTASRRARRSGVEALQDVFGTSAQNAWVHGNAEMREARRLHRLSGYA